MDDNPGRSSRSRRAVPLIAAALTVIVVTGLLYLRALEQAPKSTAAPFPIAVLSGPYSVTYDFITPSVGWSLVLDYSHPEFNRFWVFKTSDGANHWQRQFAGQSEGGYLYIHFFDDQHGFAYAGDLYRTLDGGAHWQLIEQPGAGRFFTFASRAQGWAAEFADVGATFLYSTSDGGITWTKMAGALRGSMAFERVSEMPSLEFRADGEGWIGSSTDAPIAYGTVDGGTSWREITIPIAARPNPRAERPPYLTKVRLVSGDGVIAVVSDRSGTVGAFLSSDRGASWHEISLPPTASTYDDVSFLDARQWWASRVGAIFRTADGGGTWTETPVVGLPADWNYQAVHAIDSNHAWWPMTAAARSTDSALAVTSDGGDHWKTVNLPKPG